MANTTTTHTDDWWKKYKAADEKAKGYASQIENRQPFKFDVNSDPMYEQLKDQYTQQGRLAMMDTVGNVSALTGGYGNSYAQTAGQQAFNQYMGQLNSAIPELYESAYAKWQNEGNDLYNKYQLYAGERDAVYSKAKYIDDDYDEWEKRFKNAKSPAEVEILEKRMIQSGINPEIAADWRTDYVGNLEETGYEGNIGTKRKEEIENWLIGSLQSKKLSSSFDPIKLIQSSGFLTSKEEKEYAKAVLNVLK